LLRSLNSEDWEKQTIVPEWKVKDIAAHLLDTQLRKLSSGRDEYFSEIPDLSAQTDLVDFINRLNREGVSIYRRLSPHVLISADWRLPLANATSTAIRLIRCSREICR